MAGFTQSYPLVRKRRLRDSSAILSLCAENNLSCDDLIYPMFVLEGNNKTQEIKSMPAIVRMSADLLLKEIAELIKLGIKAVALFPVISQDKKSKKAEEAYNEKGLIPSVVKQIKLQFPQMLVITDVALDPYTIHGQDGLIDKSLYVLNDETVDVLCKQALCHANAGADIVAPSDMMDGRIVAIRRTFEAHNHTLTKILSYSTKYASSFYTPFRDALSNNVNLKKADKTTYQMNPANSDEAIYESGMDVEEGADILMVKPAISYLDILYRIKSTYNLPVMAYNVSGEYAMIKAASAQGWLDEKKATLELLLSIKRAGACAILSYHAKDVAKWLKEF
jgi:porphobilinogen synthase